MNICLRGVRLLPVLLFATTLILAGRSVNAVEMPIVDGVLWSKSTTLGKHAYLIGVSNLLEVEYAYQKRNDRPPSDSQSIVRRLFESTADLSLDQMTGRVDRWYRNHPDQLEKAVLDVIWLDMVLSR